MASIKKYKLKSGWRWRVQYVDPTGQRRTRQPFATKDAAQAWADKNAVESREGDWIDPDQAATPLSEVWDMHKTGRKRTVSPSTFTALSTSWRTHIQPVWGDIPVGKIGTAAVQEWVDELAGRRSASITHRAYGLLRSLMDDAVRYRMARHNPCRGVKLPSRPRKKMHVLTEAQLHVLADAVPDDKKSLILLMGYAGTRWGEAVALTVGDIDLEGQRAIIDKSASTHGGGVVVAGTKSGRDRKVALPTPVVGELRKAMRGKLPTALVWTNQAGGHLTTPSRRSWFHSTVKRLHEKDPDFPVITPHDLRHTAASMLISKGASAVTVAHQLGHGTVSVTLNTYAHLMDGDLDAVVSAFGDRAESVRGGEKAT